MSPLALLELSACTLLAVAALWLPLCLLDAVLQRFERDAEDA